MEKSNNNRKRRIRAYTLREETIQLLKTKSEETGIPMSRIIDIAVVKYFEKNK